ncbi:hypothetical protein NONS58_15560 [Nitrosococcus oceani]|nr:hypothetical protein NONS58_15560 [Nitrosococcus oceani]
MASVGLLLLALSLRVLPTLGSVNKRMLARIHGETQTILALALDAPFHFAQLRGSHSTSMFNSKELEVTFYPER